MSKPMSEPSFRQSVDLMFNRAAALLDLPPGLEEKIRVCNATYTVRFGVRLRGEIRTFTGYRSVIPSTWSRSRAASATRPP
jgi:glutamate dehydrogenase (NAD(P)+)